MAEMKGIGMNRLRDGVIGGFRVSEIKSFLVPIEAQNPGTGMIDSQDWTKVQVKLTHDATQDMSVSQKEAYAVATVDPSRPLVLTLHTFLIPQPAIDGVAQQPRQADKAPSSDRMRWAFIKYETMQKILTFGGYVPRSKPPQRFPLPGVVFIECALSGGNNYPRRIGGPDIIDEKRKQIDEMTLTLDSIMLDTGTDKPEDGETLDNLFTAPVAAEEKPDTKRKGGGKSL